MKKNDLIKYLQDLPGNPEVVLWNGYAGDWMPLAAPSHMLLHKITKEYWIRSVENERARDGRDINLKQDEINQLIRRWKESQWEYNEYITQEDVQAGRYKKKQVIVITAKPKGIKTFDRMGALEY